jgi:thymidine kinase
MSEQLQHQRGSLGWIEVICGSMFSGKSEELIRRLRRAHVDAYEARCWLCFESPPD